MSGDQLNLDDIERTAGRMYEALSAHGYRTGLGTLSRDVPALVAEVRMLREDVAVLRRALDEIGPR